MLKRSAVPLLALVLLSLATISLAGCPSQTTGGKQPTAGKPGTTAEGTKGGEEAGEKSQVTLYFVKDGRVTPVRRSVTKSAAIGAATLRALLEGTESADQKRGLVSTIPGGTSLNSLTINEGVATVDLSAAFERGDRLDLRVAQIVYTLQQFPSVTSVRFKVAGKAVESLGGKLTLDHPVSRVDFAQDAPSEVRSERGNIIVVTPPPGTKVSSSVRVEGVARVFEANLVIELKTADGTSLARQQVTASAGAPEFGTFSADLAFRVDSTQPGVLVVTAPSAASPGEGPGDESVSIGLTLVPSR